MNRLKIFTKRSFIALFLSFILLLSGCGILINAPTQAGPTATAVGNPDISQEKLLTVHFLEVGKADAIFIQLPNGQTMIIDAGNNADGEAVVAYIKSLNVTRIDYALGTHPHEDHIGGLDNVIESFDIGKVYLPKKEHTTKTFEDLLLAIQKKGLTVTTAKAGVSILDSQGIDIELIGPVKEYSDINNNSAVVRISYAGRVLLFMGDAENKASDDIIQAGYPVKCDLLKVSHHGSSDSSNENFIQKAKPIYAVICVGDDYTPAEGTLKRLRDIGADILRTDARGTIKISVDSNGELTVQTERNG